MSWRPPVFWGLLHSKFTEVSLTFEIKFKGADGGPGERKQKTNKKTMLSHQEWKWSFWNLSEFILPLQVWEVEWAHLAKKAKSKRDLLQEEPDRRLDVCQPHHSGNNRCSTVCHSETGGDSTSNEPPSQAFSLNWPGKQSNPPSLDLIIWKTGMQMWL